MVPWNVSQTNTFDIKGVCLYRFYYHSASYGRSGAQLLVPFSPSNWLTWVAAFKAATCGKRARQFLLMKAEIPFSDSCGLYEVQRRNHKQNVLKHT